MRYFYFDALRISILWRNVHLGISAEAHIVECDAVVRTAIFKKFNLTFMFDILVALAGNVKIWINPIY